MMRSSSTLYDNNNIIMCDYIMEPCPKERTIVDEMEGVLKEAIGYVCGWETLEKEGKALTKASNPTKQLAEAKKKLQTIIHNNRNNDCNNITKCHSNCDDNNNTNTNINNNNNCDNTSAKCGSVEV